MIQKLFHIFLIVLFFGIVSCNKNDLTPWHITPYFVDGEGVSDYEGIGDQEWMAENLKSRIYCSGDSIPIISGQEYYKIYNSNIEQVDTFGLLYNYLAVEDTLDLCPCNWHVATEMDFDKLLDYLGGYMDAWLKMKSVGLRSDNSGLWDDFGANPDENRGLNSSGFNVLPAGIVFYDSSMLRNSYASFWVVSNDTPNSITYYEMGNSNYVGKQYYKNTLPTAKVVNYYSIRCIKDL